MTKIALFASGSGSNVQAIAEAVQAGSVPAEIVLIVCDKPEAFVLERADKLGIPTFAFLPREYESKEAFETDIVSRLRAAGAEYVFLAGYMRLIGPTLLEAYRNRIVNIHPSLLPAFPGKDAIGQAFDAGVKISGVTVHFVDEGMDTGPIIDQECVRVDSGMTRDDLQKAIQRIEHSLYPSVITNLLNGNREDYNR
ncbi:MULTISPECIES: phosphoribosylglycinamide formyltransferase [Bacillaceae]|uniref:Phosphoribosylglycinamide formyltransferase n=1 Tax=Domibacillus aminovorans TaxID=29332 RepID=A0A177KJG4_9BACI|nr:MULTISPECIES: phosphoribosylglycinamide formyltransferase [Bacillaceae]OAH53267.1 phosphoribosylglycinamide formyltransferase [Domibacillus aminovorans]